MALKQRSEQKKYVRIKGGKLYIGKDMETAYDELEGQLTSLYFKDEEYNGKQQRKLILVVSDEDDNYQVSINTESNSYSALVSFLRNTDLKRVFTLHPIEEIIKKDGADVSKNTILVSQDGKFIKSYFNKDDDHGLPKWNTVTVGKKQVLDKTAYLDFLENFVLTELVPEIAPTTSTKTVVNTAEDDFESVEEESDLPWITETKSSKV